ncbi:MAG: hypothetical protein H0V80_06560 [Acidobacteria bacterium]|nr:hypothetical protein [Acidobacteriota bacterium]
MNETRRRRRREAWRQATLGVLTCALCVLTGWAAWRLTPLRVHQMDIVTASSAPPDHILAHDRGGHVDHHVLFFGTDADSRQNLRRADVLLMGNSRLMFALRGDALREYFNARGMRVFALGFGHEEQHEFPVALMRRHGLRPRLVIANIDNFFGGVTSPWGERVLRDTRFDAWKTEVEAGAGHAVRRTLHRVVPHVPDLWKGEREFVIYRSQRDGSWFSATDFGHGSRLTPFYRGRDLVRPDAVALARDFKREIETIGARLVFVLMPGRDVSLTHAQLLSDEVGVPLVAPEVDGLRTMDGSHLSDDSAEHYARVFFQHLDPVLDEIRAEQR